MEKSEFRVLIKHYFLRGKTIKQTENKLKKYYGDSAPSHGMIHKWFTDFRCGRTATNDARRPGRPIEVTSEDIVNKIHDIVLADRRVKIRELADAVHISTERVFLYFTRYFGHEKAFCKMGAALTDSRPKAKTRDYF